MKKVLDLGGGHNSYIPRKDEEVIVMDYFAKGENYVKHDAEKIPFPFKNNSFDKIYASHILEHLSNLWKENKKNCVIDELWRIIKPQGELIIRMPHPSVCYNWGHPTHKRTASINSFNFLLPKSQERYSLYSWNILKKELRYTRLGSFGRLITQIANSNSRRQYVFERFVCNFIGGFDESFFKLSPIKLK